MSKSYRRKAGSAALATLTGLVLASSMVTPASAVEGAPQGEPTAQGLETQVRPDLKISPDLRVKTGPVSVYVQFSGAGAFEQTQTEAVRSGLEAPANRVGQVRAIRAGIEAQAEEVVTEASGTPLYTTTNTIPGVALQGDAEAIKALANRPDVVKITAIVPKVTTNKGADIDTRALEAWTSLDETGDGVTIAVLDTGLDYTHTGFGGPGTPEAFAEAQALTTFPSADSGLYDPDKFIGGYDLVGDDYNADPAAGEDYSPVPQPDDNPLDCQSHGSHVAGTSSGFGVNADGTTFRGDYSTLTADEVNDMRIGPGSAPESQLVSIRVFGCEGSSEVVGSALDYVLDPNGDGDFSDRAQVVNMSLGSAFPAYDDPENDIVDALTAQGVLSVVSSGNSGDVYDIGGSPGSARSALTVAASVGSQITLDRINVLAPEEGTAAGQYSANFPFADATPEQLTGTVVKPDAALNNDFGCQPFAPGTFDGQWVWLQWEENGAFPCGSGVRFNNVEAAGGEGVVLDSPRSIFDAGIGGNTTIPGVQFTAEFSEELEPAAEAGTLEIQLDSELQATAAVPSGALDTLAAFSSRGVHGSNGVIKPDVAAPGVSIGSVQVGTGSGASVKSGTSMAAPHTAGIAALVVAATTFNPYEVKSIVMNTATTDLLTADGDVYAPNRVGSGRVDAVDALETDVLAYATEDPSLTSVNYGVMELGVDEVSETRQITVENKSDQVRTYSTSYLAASEMPGVDISVSPATVDVPANGKATVDVTLAIADPTELAKTIDPAAEVEQLGVARQYLADVSGRVQLLATDGQELRIPLYSAPKPTSDLSVGPNIPFENASTLESLVTLKGRGLLQGLANEEGELESAYASIVTPLVLGEESARAETQQLESLYALDLKAVGASSTVPAVVASGGDPAETGFLDIGISTWANWGQLGGNSEVAVELDTDSDGSADFVAYTFRAEDLDLILFQVQPVLPDGSLGDVDPVYFANGVDGSVDTNTFDTNVVTLPIPVSDLDLDLEASAPIQYRITTSSSFNSDDEGNNVPVDSTDWIGFNVTEPALWFEGATATPSFVVGDGSTLVVNRQPGVTEDKAMFIHHHNVSGAKDEIVPLQIDLLRFSDTAGNEHEAAINWMADAGLTTGYTDGTYRPLGSVNRDAMAAFLYRLAGEPTYVAPTVSPFSDITPDTKFYKEMSWLAENEITTGYSDGTYRPLAPVNRDAMAAFMNRFAGEYCNIADAVDYTNPSTASFRDVPTNLQFAREISWMKDSGISTGWRDGTYRPVVPVARDAMAAFIQRLDAYETDGGGCKP